MNVHPNFISFTQLHTVKKSATCGKHEAGTGHRNEMGCLWGLREPQTHPASPGSKIKIEFGSQPKKTSSLRNSALKESHSKLTNGSPPTRLVPVALHTPLYFNRFGKSPRTSLLARYLRKRAAIKAHTAAHTPPSPSFTPTSQSDPFAACTLFFSCAHGQYLLMGPGS
jgi:hypothetical protein